MKLAIMQPYLFPYIGYFQLMNAVNKFVVYDNVNFIKKGWINRNNILINGKGNMFTIPLKDASQNKLINEIYLSDEPKWRIIFLKTIELSYKKAPYFDKVYPLIENSINFEVEKISALVFNSLKVINNYLGIRTELLIASEMQETSHLKGQDRILALCKAENAGHYINPIGGQEIYSRELFEKQEILLSFLETGPITYKQFKDEFVPGLSIIDMLMFNSNDEMNLFLNLYKLM